MEIETTGDSTYCPEDNKLRLYVGRVPRDEYIALKALGFISTPKQDCDFVSVWTPAREDIALAYGDGYIGDEDQSPQDRAADRAERFIKYREKRTGEALGRADSYDVGPSVHGYQSQALADRRARAHDRQAVVAVTQWGKAEYWQSRTAGVISHALHVSSPGVRMGRVRVIESDLRRHIGAVGYREGASRWADHLTNRLAYENQMLEAQGGRAAHVDMIAGGWIGSHQILKVNKSSVTGRVTSVEVKGQRFTWDDPSGTILLKTERLAKEVYRAPTDEELGEFKVSKKAEKKSRPKPPPRINPTQEDAERLQGIWGPVHAMISGGKIYTPALMTQREYSFRSKCGGCELCDLVAGGRRVGYRHGELVGEGELVIAKIRRYYGQVVILTDKPQKPLPAGVWEEKEAEPCTELTA